LEGYRLEKEEHKAYKDHIREGLVKYTRKAFRMLPKRPIPCILDIGCGSGVPTMELAKLSDGEIIAIDTSQTALYRLASKISKAGLAARVEAEKCSMFNMDFPDASFDIIWAEGSISVIDFEKGLKEWRRLLKTEGFLVVHDDRGDLTEKRRQISQCGYDLINHFVLSEDIWWNEYYAPLEEKFNEVRAKHTSDQKTITVLDDDQREIDTFKRDPKLYRSVFFIMRKS
jgi:ubiquinone/menaquinone biosynthesis C-methylase UbiE